MLLPGYTSLPTPVSRQCAGLKHVVFLGTGARSYMNPEELGELGIAVHTIKGYGDTAMAECAVALMWAAARGFARMDRDMRAGNWLRTDAMQLTGRTIGLLGFGGIAAEVARLALGMGMRVLAWNRSPKAFTGVRFVELGQLLACAHHLAQCDAVCPLGLPHGRGQPEPDRCGAGTLPADCSAGALKAWSLNKA